MEQLHLNTGAGNKLSNSNQKALIKEAIKRIWKEYGQGVESKHHVICLLRVKTVDGMVWTLGELQKLCKEELNY
jgi:hypothetical protein